MVYANRLRPADVDLVCTEAGEHQQFLACAGYGDVQASLTAIAVQGAEIHRPLAGSVFSEGDRKQYDVPFVALDVFEVLHDHRLDPVVGIRTIRVRGCRVWLRRGSPG